MYGGGADLSGDMWTTEGMWSTSMHGTLSHWTLQHGRRIFILLVVLQGAYNSGKLREFFNSGKLRENSGNFKFTPGILLSVIGHRVLCIIIVSNNNIDWLGGTVTGVGGASPHAP